MHKAILDIFIPGSDTYLELPLYSTPVRAGFPSPADDHLDKKIDLNEYMIQNPSSTFFVRVQGDSMQDCNINDGDLLVVDKALEPHNGDIIVGIVNGEFTVKCLSKKGKQVFLQPANARYAPIEITEGMDFMVWGVVIYTIHKNR
jgi:DNA polymerase V